MDCVQSKDEHSLYHSTLVIGQTRQDHSTYARVSFRLVKSRLAEENARNCEKIIYLTTINGLDVIQHIGVNWGHREIRIKNIYIPFSRQLYMTFTVRVRFWWLF